MKISKYLFIFSILLMICCSVACNNEKKVIGDKKIKVSASIIPIADFVRQIGGDYVELNIVIPPGANPHVFEPSPEQLVNFSDSDIFVFVGSGFEFWKDKFISSSGKKEMILVELSKDEELLDEHEHKEHEHEEHNHVKNPHIWVSPEKSLKFIPIIEKSLSEIDPKHASEYKKNAEIFKEKILKLDKECKENIANFKNKKFLSQHASWSYFANDYGLEEVGNIEKFPGREATPAEIEELIKTAKSYQVNVIFTDAQFSEKAAKAVAESGNLKIVSLDILGNTNNISYIDMMNNNLEKISEVMK